ncbi:MAG: hypothetical protein WD844_08025 [Thermoleophilaceae bacterium]
MAPASAFAELDVSVIHYRDLGQSDFSVIASSSDGRVNLHISSGDFVYDYELDWVDSAEFRWSCRRTGLHRWSAVALYPDGTSEAKRGRFRVGRCETRRDRVARTTVMDYIDSEQFASQFVSRISCQVRVGRRGHRARVWRCSVTWNDVRRECSSRFDYRRTSRIRFGDVVSRDWSVRRRSPYRCSRFF